MFIEALYDRVFALPAGVATLAFSGRPNADARLRAGRPGYMAGPVGRVNRGALGGRPWAPERSC